MRPGLKTAIPARIPVPFVANTGALRTQCSQGTNRNACVSFNNYFCFNLRSDYRCFTLIINENVAESVIDQLGLTGLCVYLPLKTGN